jgi:HAD superfamily hydrolase (TIGR01450 family)
MESLVFNENITTSLGVLFMRKINSDLENINAIFLDLDGTIYMGDNLIKGAIDFLNRIEKRGIKRFFLSNNSSKSVDQYLLKLEKMGIPATKEEILLSTHDLLSWLKVENISETYLVGTEGMKEMLEEVGVNTRSEEPQYVVLGYDTEITYQKLTKASIYLHNGVPLVVSHPDMVCPSPNGGLPDTGAYLALFEATTGVTPKHICGKPNPGMILHKINELGLETNACAMVGDRLYTDMEMADRAGVHGILVLSGEATAEDAANAPQSPSLIVDSVAQLC